MNFLNFVLYSLHLSCVVVFVGGLIFSGIVINPATKAENDNGPQTIRRINQRFIKIGWICIVFILVTGVIMMFVGKWSERQTFIIASKQLIFLLMIFFTYGDSKMTKYLDAHSSNGGFDEKAEIYRFRITQFRKINIYLGLTALLLSVILRLNV